MSTKVIKTRAVTFSFKLDQYDIDDLVQTVEPHRYAWIIHDGDIKPDTGEFKDPHIHFFVQVESPRSLNWFSDFLEVPINQLQKVKSTRAILRYFCHLDNPEKSQYNPTDVKANFDYQSAIASDNINYSQLYADYSQVGVTITPQQFVKKYNRFMCKSLSSVLTVFDKLRTREVFNQQYNVSEGFQGTQGKGTRACL